ncbi:MAG: SDR family oxidoreductase [Gemmatimonadota bacterium]
MANYLVTGGAGFIGSHLCHRLLRDGHAVRVLDNLSSGKRQNLPAGVDFVEGDLRDTEALRRAAAGVEFVLHEAAIASVQVSVEQPLLEQEVNLVGTLRLLEAARAAGVRRLVFAASAAAYGMDPEVPKREAMRPTPASPYGLSKVAGEYYCRVWAEVFGLETVCLRYFNVFGPRQDPKSPYSGVISIFLARMLGGEAPTIYGDGEQSRDFTYVDNVVEANVLACRARRATGEVYNIGCARQISVNQLVQHLNDVLGTRLAPRHVEGRAGDVRVSVADIARAAEGLGYRPAVDFETGLARTVEWMRASAG